MADSSFAFVSLLLLCNGSDAATTFTDSGPDSRTVSVFGNAQLDTAQVKFGSASALFDGTGDYLTLADEPGLNFDTGDFTIEFWVRLNSTAATQTIINKALTTGTSQYRIYFDSATAKFTATTRNSANSVTTTCTAPSTSTSATWYHVAFVRSGDTFTLYVDGAPSTPQTRSGAMFATTQTVSIGGNNNGSTAFNGWLDDIRFTKGSARYTAAFTPPSAELETGTAPTEKNFASVALLLHCEGSDAATTFTDSSSSPKTVTAVGNAQIDTADFKFGSAAALFDGTGDYLTVPNSTGATGLNVATGNFTIEFWVKLNSAGANVIIAQQATATGSYPWQIWFEASTSKFGFRGFNAGAGSSYAMQQTGTSTTGVWYHLAAVRDGDTFRFFVDGVANGTATLSGALFATTATISFGASNNGVAPLNGWLDDIRFTKGVARYTAAFTPPSAAFQDGDDILGRISAPAMFGSPALFGGVGLVGSIATPAIFGAPSIFGGLAIGSIKSPAILGGTAGAKLFGSLVVGSISMRAILDGATSPALLALHDFSAAVVDRTTQYVMDLLVNAEANTRVRVPISSWQGTQQTGSDSYLACVIPACEPWLETLAIATHFIISRRVTLDDGAVLEAEMARAPLETVQVDEGPTNYTASISGYSDPYPADADPDAARDRTLQGVRSISVYETGVRLRCAIDWLLRPAQRAFYGETPFIVSYINYYVTANTASVDEYMDVGERIEG